MKARKGDAIVCSQRHEAGRFTVDLPANKSIRLHMLALAGPNHFKLHAYGCCDCDELVAFRIKSTVAWKVRTLSGWLK